VTFVDNNFYQNAGNHYGFAYQNPSYARNEHINSFDGYADPSTYRHADHNYERFENLKLATIYVKPQVYNGINSPADALKQGTAFRELYSPFAGKGGQR